MGVVLCSLGHGVSGEGNKKGTGTTLPIHYVTCNIPFYLQHILQYYTLQHSFSWTKTVVCSGWLKEESQLFLPEFKS